jgi:hypothetical protein
LATHITSVLVLTDKKEVEDEDEGDGDTVGDRVIHSKADCN